EMRLGEAVGAADELIAGHMERLGQEGLSRDAIWARANEYMTAAHAAGLPEGMQDREEDRELLREAARMAIELAAEDLKLEGRRPRSSATAGRGCLRRRRGGSRRSRRARRSARTRYRRGGVTGERVRARADREYRAVSVRVSEGVAG